MARSLRERKIFRSRRADVRCCRMVEVLLDGGVTLAYEQAGAGEPVVTIHGAFIGDAFLPLLREEALTERYRLLAYRRRGYGGRGAPPGETSMAEQAEDCRALMRRLGISRAHVVGHSYGGAIALELALGSPDLVHSLVLLEPALAVGASGEAYLASLRQGELRFRKEGGKPVIEAMLRARSVTSDPVGEIERALPGAFEQAIADAATPFESELPALRSWRFGEAEARRIASPALVVLGEESRRLSTRFEETYRALTAWLPGAEGYLFPGAAHMLPLENPTGLAAVLRTFFERHPLGARVGHGLR